MSIGEGRGGSDGVSDAALVDRVRAGDLAAYGQLFARHVASVTRLARLLTRPVAQADDLVSVVFAEVLQELRTGPVPVRGMRLHLLRSVLAADAARATTPTTPALAHAAAGPAAPLSSSAVAQAFGSLPEPWQTVLWHLDVEHEKPSAVAPVLGVVSAAAVTALADQARHGLHQAYLSVHLDDLGDFDDPDDLDDLVAMVSATGAACRRTHDALPALVRGELSPLDQASTQEHLDTCRACAGAALAAARVHDDKGALVATAVLGSLAPAYLTPASPLRSLPTRGVLATRASEVLRSGSRSAVALGTAASITAVAALGLYIAHGGDNDDDFALSDPGSPSDSIGGPSESPGSPPPSSPTSPTPSPTPTPTPTPPATPSPLAPSSSASASTPVPDEAASSTPASSSSGSNGGPKGNGNGGNGENGGNGGGQPVTPLTSGASVAPTSPAVPAVPVTTPDPGVPAFGDVTVAADVSRVWPADGVAARIDAVVTNMPGEGRQARLLVTTTGDVHFTGWTPGCAVVAAGLDCLVTQATSGYTYYAVNASGPATFSFDVQPVGWVDPSPDNNSDLVSVEPNAGTEPIDPPESSGPDVPTGPASTTDPTDPTVPVVPSAPSTPSTPADPTDPTSSPTTAPAPTPDAAAPSEAPSAPADTSAPAVQPSAEPSAEPTAESSEPTTAPTSEPNSEPTTPAEPDPPPTADSTPDSSPDSAPDSSLATPAPVAGAGATPTP